MSIITLAEYKTFPCYSTNQSDSIISELIDDVEVDFLFIRNREFKGFTGNVTDASAIITSVNNISGIKKNDWIESDNINGKVLSLSKDDATITLDTDATGTAEEDELMVYPAGIKRVVSEMINFKIETYTGITRESLENHSVDYGEISKGYPKSIVRSIKRYL